MGSATNEIDIDRPADDVWALVGDFGGLAEWMPGIDSCRVDGDDRVIQMMGMEVVESLRRRDGETRTLAYGISQSPMGLEHHEATITVTPTGDASSHVTYSLEVRPDSMTEVMSGAYGSALQALKAKLES